MNDQVSQARDPVEILAEEFLERRRRGEVPSLAEYTTRYPHLAEEIRDVFPALVMMDDIDPQSAELARSLGGMLDLYGQSGLKRLGDFRILRVIGQGGMGIVYEAQQESLGRHVALKVLPPSISCRAQFRERFQREARAAAQLHHTNIVPIFGVGEDQGVLYYAMQFIQGQALDSVLDDVRRIRGHSPIQSVADGSTVTQHVSQLARSLVDGRFPAVELYMGAQALPLPVELPKARFSETHSDLGAQPECRYFRSIAWQGVQVAEGLAHAHAQGILHRDIKPSNLLLDAQGTLWITDFGLAKTEGSADITQSGEFVGTLRYMAPERLQGKGDARSDIYALGVTLYEMITLTPPFTGSDRVGLIGQISEDTPAAPSRLAPLLPRDLETIVLKAMAREPAGRYTTAREMANDLRCFLENRPIKARRTSTIERLGRWCRRNPAVASLIGAVFLLLLCLTIGSTAAAFRLNAERKAVISAEADGAEKLYESLVAQANASRFSHRVGQRFGTLEAVRKAVELVRERHMPIGRLDGLRNLAIASLALPDFQTVRSWSGFGPGDQAWDADDQFHLYARWSPPAGNISVRRLGTDEEIALLEGKWESGAFSPGGRYLLCSADHRFQVWDVSGARPQAIHEGEQYGFAFSHDGRTLLTGGKDGSLWVHNLEAPAQKPSLLAKLSAATEVLAFDPKDTRLAVICAGKAQILDAKTGQFLASIPETGRQARAAWHPSGNYLALVPTLADPVIHIWDPKRMTRVASLKGTRGEGIRVAFTPDGDRLLGEDWSGMLRLWDWRMERQVLQEPGFSNPKFGTNGRILILDSDGKDFRLVELTNGHEYRSFVRLSALGKDISYWTPVAFPGGRLFAVPMSDGIRLFDVETGDEVAVLPPTQFMLALQGDKAFLTNGNHGLLRWPVHHQDAITWRFGPPRVVHPMPLMNLASSRDGEIIAQATGSGAILVRTGKPSVFLGPHGGAKHTAISPDGNYVVTSINEGEERVKIWDTGSQRLLASLPMGRLCGGLFSPDGRWLLVHGGRGCQVLKIGTWEKAYDIQWNTLHSFSPDSSTLSSSSNRGDIRLLETASGRELAKLEDPNQAFGNTVFSADGARLLISNDNDKSIHVWNLRLIRAELVEMGLDWDAPPYPEAPACDPLPLQVKVDLGTLFLNDRASVGLCTFRLVINPLDFQAYFERGLAHGRLHDPQKAISDYSLALVLMPLDHKLRGDALFRRSNNFRTLNDQARMKADLQQFAELDLTLSEDLVPSAAQQCNNLAWDYVTGPLGRRDPEKAVPLAQKAVTLACSGVIGPASEGIFVNTLGVVYYRLGRYAEATVTLERSLRETKGQFAAFDQFFLAMCHARQGEPEEARKYFDQAVRWVRLNQETIGKQLNWSEELKGFQAEAEVLLKR